MNTSQNVYRSFVYLDVDRIQSIIAQLEEGLLTEIMSGNQQDIGATGHVGTAGLLSQFLSLGTSIEGKLAYNTHHAKVLHDYSFTVALNALQSSGFIVDSTSFDFHSHEFPGGVFASITGSVGLIDYASLGRLAEHEDFLTNLTPSAKKMPEEPDPYLRPKKGGGKNKAKSSDKKNTAVFKPVKEFIDAFYGDMIQITIEDANNQRFLGILERAQLRERVNELIFKYGSHLQGDWIVLAEITRVPTMASTQNLHARLNSTLSANTEAPISTPKEGMDQMVAALNYLTEFMGSVSYPEIAIAPIALYREVRPPT